MEYTDGMIVTVPPPQPVKIRFTVNQTPGSSSSLTPATGSGSSHGKLKKGAVGGGGGQRAKHARIGKFDFQLIATPIPISSSSNFNVPYSQFLTSQTSSHLVFLSPKEEKRIFSLFPGGRLAQSSRPCWRPR
jgi:hypothetical protein